MPAHVVDEASGRGAFGHLFVCEVEKEYGAHCTHQEDHIKPPMIKVKLQIPQNLCENGPILRSHIHTKQYNRWKKVCPHDLSNAKDNQIGGLRASDGIEEFGECQQKTTDRGYDNHPNQPKGDLLRPEGHVYVKTEVVHCYIDSSGNWILKANSIEKDVYDTDDNFPDTVATEEVTETVEVLALEGTRILNSFFGTA